jgi:sodium transport system permease protein
MRALAVFRKELRETIRDRRSLFSGLFYGVWGPMVMGIALLALARDRADIGTMPLVVEGPSRAPALVAFLASRDIDVIDGDADLAAAIRDRRTPIALSIDEGYGADFLNQRTARVTLLFDGTWSESARRAARMRTVLTEYSRGIADTRLVLRGVAPAAITPVRVLERDFSTAAGRAAGVLATMPIFILLAAFVGGMSVAADLTAGERERGSLESLLLHPVDRLSIVAGKWLAASAVAVATVAVTVMMSQLVLRHPRLLAIDLPIGLPHQDALAIFLLLAPLALCAAALQLLVALFARTYKEAQTQLSLFVFAPMIPGFLFAFGSLQPAPWMRLTPMLGQHVFITDLVRGQALPLIPAAQLTIVTLAVAGLALVAVAALLGRESILRRHGD